MLTDRDRLLLEFEIARPRHTSTKEAAIRFTFDLSSARFYQHINRIIGMPDALSEFPMEVRRLLRRRILREKTLIGGSATPAATP